MGDTLSFVVYFVDETRVFNQNTQSCSLFS
jgi:hypothetical protein